MCVCGDLYTVLKRGDETDDDAEDKEKEDEHFSQSSNRAEDVALRILPIKIGYTIETNV